MRILSVATFLFPILTACTPNVAPPEVPASAPSDELTQQALSVPSPYLQGTFANKRALMLPSGFHIQVYAAGLRQPRSMAFSDRGVLYVTDKAGSVLRLDDADRDGVAENVVTVASGLRNPHGIEWHEGDLYVGEEHQVIALSGLDVEGAETMERVVTALPAGGAHVTRTVRVGSDRKLYVSAGSTCNTCEERDERRAAITRYNVDGSGEEVVARGLRNSVGMIFRGSELWTVENGSDMRGDDIPPEEVNVIESGKHYGWPYCYGHQETDPSYAGQADFCRTTEPPRFLIQAHSAPLGLRFLEHTTSWPEGLVDDLFIAYHGSWNRSVPTGYKIVTIDEGDGSPRDFITGWLSTDGTSWGRPVDVIFGPDDALYITDDKAGAIYRVWYD